VLACVEKRGELRWVVGCSLGGERWDVEEEGGEEGETEEERVSVNPPLISPVVATCPCLAVRV